MAFEPNISFSALIDMLSHAHSGIRAAEVQLRYWYILGIHDSMLLLTLILFVPLCCVGVLTSSYTVWRWLRRMGSDRTRPLCKQLHERADEPGDGNVVLALSCAQDSPLHQLPKNDECVAQCQAKTKRGLGPRCTKDAKKKGFCTSHYNLHRKATI